MVFLSCLRFLFNLTINITAGINGIVCANVCDNHIPLVFKNIGKINTNKSTIIGSK